MFILFSTSCILLNLLNYATEKFEFTAKYNFDLIDWGSEINDEKYLCSN